MTVVLLLLGIIVEMLEEYESSEACELMLDPRPAEQHDFRLRLRW